MPGLSLSLRSGGGGGGLLGGGGGRALLALSVGLQGPLELLVLLLPQPPGVGLRPRPPQKHRAADAVMSAAVAEWRAPRHAGRAAPCFLASLPVRPHVTYGGLQQFP